MSQPLSFVLRFSLPWKRSKDIGWALSKSQSLSNSGNCILGYHDPAAVKPILDISDSGSPLKIVGPVIKLVFIHVVDNLKVQRVWDKGNSNQPMDKKGLCLPLNGEIDFPVTGGSDSSRQDVRSEISSSVSRIYVESAVISNAPTDATDAPERANLVDAFISRDISPLFSWQANLVNYWSNAKQALNGRLNIQLASILASTAVAAKVSNEVAVVARSLEDFGVQGALRTMKTMFSNPLQTADAGAVRDFINSFVTWDGQPSFSFTHYIAPTVLSFTTTKAEYRACRQSRQHNKLTSKIKETVVCR